MMTLRPAQDRGHANLGWLDSWHTFSFSRYYDPQHMGFRSLRVINDDRIAPGTGFGTHGHEDMEIITYMLEGELAHADNMGTGAVLHPGDVQRMSAGTGVMHSEINRSAAPVHLLQIWIEPDKLGIKPAYDDRNFPLAQRQDRWCWIASSHGREGALSINQDAEIAASVLSTNARLSHELKPGRHAWVQIARGQVELNGLKLSSGDGVAISDEATLEFIAKEGGVEMLLFDLA